MSVNANLRARLAQVDASILELNLRLKSLEDNKQSIQDQLDGVVYPILTLPREITSEIFLHCLPPSPEVDGTMNTGPGSSRASLLLQVCRAWRDVAISTPRLWVCLHLNLPNIYDKVGPVEEPELEKMIEDRWLRAGTCALSFSVRGRAYNELGATAIRNTLLHHAHRLRSISLTLPRRFLTRLVDIGPFPVLETLAVANPFDRAGGSNRLEILGAAPRLQKLIYSGSAGPSRLLFSCRELSVVACEIPLSPDEFFEVVLCAPSLENFTGCVGEGEGTIARLDAVTHGCLQTLHLSYASSLYFLRLLRLPALQNIHLGTNVLPDECPDFLSFLAHSSASLRRFSTSIHDIPLATDWFSTSMPYLTDIELYNPHPVFLGDFFRKLDRAQDKEFLLHLQSLAFRDCILDVVLDAPLLEALSSRCMADEGSSILRSFQVWPPNLVDQLLDESQTTALRALIERGMKIFVGEDEL